MTPILLVTRPAAAADRFVAKVRNAAKIELNVVLSPSFTIDPLQVDLPDEGFDHLIVTSFNGVHQAKRLGAPKGTPTWCVGKATTQVAMDLGFDARFAGETADTLVKTLIKVAPRGGILHLSGVHTRGNIVERLTQAGMTAQRIETYNQSVRSPTDEAITAFAGRHPIVLPVFSPRSACLLSRQKVSAPIHLIAMSSAVKAAFLSETWLNCTIAEQPTEDEMVNATVKVLNQIS